jgi:hypothetical protein
MMDRLNELFAKQNRQYMNRMNYLAWHLQWRTKTPFERMLFNGKI